MAQLFCKNMYGLGLICEIAYMGRGDYVRLVKNMKGDLSSYKNWSGRLARREFSKDPLLVYILIENRLPIVVICRQHKYMCTSCDSFFL